MNKLSLILLSGVLLIPLSTSAKPPFSGGETTTGYFDAGAFSQPASNLSLTRRDSFFVGNSFFTNAWVSAPSSTSARDGLGPLFNSNTCQSCHIKDGKGRPPKEGEILTSMLLRLSIPNEHAGNNKVLKELGVVPEPTYGDQLQNRSVNGVPAEADVEIEWEPVKGVFDDGTEYTLRKPKISLKNLQYGELHKETMYSLRAAPAMIGMGLLEAISEEDLLANADPDDKNNDGISGRANYVWDIKAEQKVLGRFGWKANQPNVEQQSAAAFAGDIGITSNLFPAQPCTEKQADCLTAPHGGIPEVSDEILDTVTFYSKSLAVPIRRKLNNFSVKRGEQLFRKANCNACHVETFTTGTAPDFPEFSHQEIHPYTDLLLHDMGEGLADNRPEYEASGSEWRTPPLWGIGLIERVSRHTNFLHDGRARNIEEAILWHGGEAESARDFYKGLSRQERNFMIFFLNSL